MKKLFILPLCLLAFAACESRQRQPAPQNALAAAAGAYITQEDFDKKAAQYDADFQKFIATEPGRQNFLNFLINDAILNAAARDSGIADSAAYKEEIEALKAQQAQAFKERQEMLLKELFTKKLLEDGTTAVSEEEIRAYHRRYPYQIRLLHILLPDAAQAERVMRNMGRSPNRAEFEAAAKRYSIDPQTKNSGGQLEPFIPGEYLPEIEIPAANTPVNQMQGFIKTPFGFHIIMKTQEESLSYNNAKDRIKSILEKQKTDAYLQALKDKYGAEVIVNENK